MPDYKRKKFKKTFNRKKNRINYENTVIEKNKTNRTIVPSNNIKVVRGTKLKKQRKIKILLSFLAFICLFSIILSVVLPVGLYENITNFISSLGYGSYPASVSGDVVLNTFSNGSHYYILTDTNIAAYSNNGKIIFNELHGFSNPVLNATDTRAIVYNQGGKNLFVYNLKGRIHSLDTKDEIITASISRNGNFAIATNSDSYASVATVYNKNFKKIFTWNSAKDIINNVLVNNSGTKLAVTLLNVASGEFTNKLSIFNFESADPLHTLELNASLPLSLINTGKGISIICSDQYKFINWSKYTTSEVKTSGEINLVRNSKNGLLLVFNRVNDRSDNKIVLISKNGEKATEFNIRNNILDIQYKNGRVYSITDTTATIYDKNGKIMRFGECEYGIQKIAVISANSFAAITDNQVIKTVIEQKGE